MRLGNLFFKFSVSTEKNTGPTMGQIRREQQGSLGTHQVRTVGNALSDLEKSPLRKAFENAGSLALSFFKNLTAGTAFFLKGLVNPL